ncbi:Modification methylase DpnIIB [Klebsiella variicola]|uniref:DNA-methyltransferase n=1 Tax=Klebsiella variicola TaxID=244366 RepID=UPI00109C47C3|nr:site-specific DNA-methyltransferase [Klebsiella variicola]VGQ12956.1 Modification methylase DpnIIB [Klebsiella variicola]
MQNPFSLFNGDCLDAMRSMPDASVDSIVTDPPYGISFMAKGWDKAVPPAEIWAECLRVLKPGGYLLAFAGTRTQHRMATNIEDAGFEIRDLIAWVYGSGFPKSVSLSKSIDKKYGAEPVVIGEYDRRSLYDGANRTSEADTGESQCAGRAGTVQITAPATPAAQKWEGWGSALKPALEPVTVARKPFTGTLTDNVLQFGTGGLNIDGCRISSEDALVRPSIQRDDNQVLGKGLGVGTQTEPGGRWPANLAHDGSPEVLEHFPAKAGAKANVSGNEPSKNCDGTVFNVRDRIGFHRQIDSGSAARFFYCPKASKADRDLGLRCSVVSASEMVNRKEGSAGINNPRAGAGRTSGAMNFHPTVKPIALMQWLARLVTPAGGIILDPFMGSGTTGIAAAREGFTFIGCELNTEYFDLARARISAAYFE